jgi:hypothetical protein
MSIIPKLAFAAAWAIVASLVRPQPADAQGTFDLMVGPATSVLDADSKFDQRLRAAIKRNASQPLPSSALKNEPNYGLYILARLAYLDYFPNEPLFGETLRQEAFASLTNQTIQSLTGTDWDTTLFKDSPFEIELFRRGDYDVVLTAYTAILYKYSEILPTEVREHLMTNLLNKRGPFVPDDLSWTAFAGGALGSVSVPETENHILMIYTARFLANQLLYARTVDPLYNNDSNGMTDWMLRHLSLNLRRDFIEYNSRPYQDYTMTALLNLYSYSREPRVKKAAQMILDYISAKVAVSSNEARRWSAWRRKSTYLPKADIIEGNYDPQTAFFMMLAGNTSMLASNGDERRVPGPYAYEFQWAGLSEYRIPAFIHDLFVTPNNRNFYQRIQPCFSPFGGVCESGIYFGSPSYLISAGGMPTGSPYPIRVLGQTFTSSDDYGVVLSTTFMPTGFGASIKDLIRFEPLGMYYRDCSRPDDPFSGDWLPWPTSNMGVAPNFACGLNLIIPAVYTNELACVKQVSSNGIWTFVNRAGSCAKDPSYGYYLALYQGTNARFALDESSFFLCCLGLCPSCGPCRQYAPASPPFGFFEAFDARQNPQVTFDHFVNAVLNKNGSKHFYSDTTNSYVTMSEQEIQFTCHPDSWIVATIGGSPVPNPNVTSGTIINSDGNGLITIDNPVLRMRLRLDMLNPLSPHRIEEQLFEGSEIWVDFNFNGISERGTYALPFNTLSEGVSNVPPGGGTLKIKASSTGERNVFSNPMRIIAVDGRVVIGE